MRWSRACSTLLLLFASNVAACSTDHGDCSCTVEAATERRTLACGTSACIDGQRLACVNQAEIAQRGACTPSSAVDHGDDPTPPSEQPSSTDTACNDLQTYCAGSCSSPANTSADCQATAAAQDNDACRQWLLANSVLCRP